MISRVISTLAVLVALCPFPAALAQQTEPVTVTFAGGCFWCMEPPFDEMEGVLDTTAGYAGGNLPNPDYDQVSAGGTGHAEVVRVSYDPEVVSFEELLETYWRNIDPVDPGGQFCDRGSQYRSAIFAETDKQLRLATRSRKSLAESGQLSGEIVTEIDRLQEFYAAEEYHQDYYQKNPIRYNFYKFTCGRENRLEELWQ